MDIAAWLRDLGLERYAQAFRDNEIDTDILPTLTAEDLSDLGVTLVGHRRKLLNAIGALAEPEESSPEAVIHRRPSEAERRQLTVMFVDLVGSTALSAKLDPEDMREVLRAYQNAVAGEITRFEGHVAKFMGDGVLGYFGWPRAHEDEAERAVRAGLAMTHAVSSLRDPAGVRLAARVGIATGLVVVGDLVGEGASREQAVVGDTPNLAARLQALAQPGQVVIAEATRRLVGAGFEFGDLGAQSVKGIAEPVGAFAALGERALESRFEAHSGQVLPMVGRDRELALLLERWAQAKTGEGQGVMLVGEAGIGKSRISRALLDAVAEEPHVRLRYQCSPYHTDSALWPVIQQLSHAAGFAADDSPETRLDKLEAVLDRAGRRDAAPLIASLVGLDGTERYGELNLTPQTQRTRTLAALVDQLLGLAAQQPVLLVLEDAHWIDPTTLELIEQCLDRIAEARVLLLLTSRPDNQPELAGRPHVTRLSLKRLGRGGAEAIVARLGGDQLPSQTVAAIIARTDGVPLFIEELTKAVVETGETTIPASLHDSLMARLDRIPEVKEVAQTAACIGREFDFSLLAAVADRPEAEVQSSLAKLVATELIFRRGILSDARYTFKHALVQDAAYGTLLKTRRQQLHARIAQVLTEGFLAIAEAQPEVLAHHLTEAGLSEQAIRYWERAGRRAIGRFANAEATGHLTKALELYEALPEAKRRDQQELRLRIALIVPLIAVHGFGSIEVERCAHQAKEISDRFGDTEHRFAAVRAVWNSNLLRRPVPKTIALSAELLRLAGASRDPVQLAVAHRSRGYSLFVAGQLGEAHNHLVQGIELADSIGDVARFEVYGEYPAMVCRTYAAQTLTILGEIGRATTLADEAIDIAIRLANPHTLVWALAVAAHIGSHRRDAEIARVRAEAAIELAHEHRLPQWLAMSTFLHGWALSEAGDLEAGIVEMERGRASWRDTGAVLHTTLMHCLLATARCAASDLERGRADLTAAFAHLKRFSERYVEAELHRIEALFERREGRPATNVEAVLRRAVATAEGQGARLWELRAATSLARLWAEQAERQKAHDLLAPVYGWFTEGFDTPDLKDAKALLDALR